MKKPSEYLADHSCGVQLKYNERFDADYCEPCDEWIHPPCGSTSHRDCPFECWKRPDKPSMLKEAISP